MDLQDNFTKTYILYFIGYGSLLQRNGCHSTCVDLGWVTMQTAKNLGQIVCKFDPDQIEHKSLEVNESARKAWLSRVTNRPKF